MEATAVPRSTGAMVCPGCRKLIEVSDPSCPYCGQRRLMLWGYGPALTRLLGAADPTAIIVGASVVLYVIALLLDLPGALRPRGLMGILGPSPRALTMLGMTGGVPWAQGQVWTVMSATYLHAGILHILFNMMWIRSLGPAVEEIYGPARAFVLFQLAGATGFLASNLLSGVPTVGASGAIFGLLAAILAHGHRAGRSLMTSQVLSWALILFVFGFVMPGVNNLAHAGGFAGGWLGATLMGAGLRRREGTGTQLVALASGILSLVAIGLSVAVSL
jgi:rhomboid protease GluP